jgi:hypothetical protein
LILRFSLSPLLIRHYFHYAAAFADISPLFSCFRQRFHFRRFRYFFDIDYFRHVSIFHYIFRRLLLRFSSLILLIVSIMMSFSFDISFIFADFRWYFLHYASCRH